MKSMGPGKYELKSCLDEWNGKHHVTQGSGGGERVGVRGGRRRGEGKEEGEGRRGGEGRYGEGSDYRGKSSCFFR